MKSIETIFCELRESLLLSGKLSESLITETVKGLPTVEQKISALEKLRKEKNIKESGRPVRVRRNNGASVTEGAENHDQARVEKAMRVHKMTIREASIFCGLADPGPSAKPGANFNEGLRDRWKKHMGGLISESDLNQLVERQIEPK